MKGRKPKPTAQRRLEGNPGRRPLNASEPLPKRGRPRCPAWLPASARAKWKALVPELDRLCLLTIVDGETLASYCLAWSELQASTEAMEREGRVCRMPIVVKEKATIKVDGKDVEVLQDKVIGHKLTAHPAVAQQRSAWAAIRAFAALFGLDPSSRSRLTAPQTQEEDPLKAFIGGA